MVLKSNTEYLFSMKKVSIFMNLLFRQFVLPYLFLADLGYSNNLIDQNEVAAKFNYVKKLESPSNGKINIYIEKSNSGPQYLHIRDPIFGDGKWVKFKRTNRTSLLMNEILPSDLKQNYTLPDSFEGDIERTFPLNWLMYDEFMGKKILDLSTGGGFLTHYFRYLSLIVNKKIEHRSQYLEMIVANFAGHSSSDSEQLKSLLAKTTDIQTFGLDLHLTYHQKTFPYFFQGSSFKNNFKSSTFDGLISIYGVPYYLANSKNFSCYLEEAFRILKPGGWFRLLALTEDFDIIKQKAKDIGFIASDLKRENQFSYRQWQRVKDDPSIDVRKTFNFAPLEFTKR